MTDPPLTFTVHCAACGDKLTTTGQHQSTFEFLSWAQLEGWTIPLALDNKPIVCPKCHKNP